MTGQDLWIGSRWGEMTRRAAWQLVHGWYKRTDVSLMRMMPTTLQHDKSLPRYTLVILPWATLILFSCTPFLSVYYFISCIWIDSVFISAQGNSINHVLHGYQFSISRSVPSYIRYLGKWSVLHGCCLESVEGGSSGMTLEFLLRCLFTFALEFRPKVA